MFFKNISSISVVLSIFLLCNITGNIHAMDGIIKLIGKLITNTIQADDNQPEKHIFYYANRPVTEKSFNILKEIAFKVDFDKSCPANEADDTSQEFTESLYNTWEDQFHKDHAQITLETTTALAKVVKRYITVNHTDDLQKIVFIEYNDITAEFTDGMALLLYDIKQANRKSCDLDKKGKKIQW